MASKKTETTKSSVEKFRKNPDGNSSGKSGTNSSGKNKKKQSDPKGTASRELHKKSLSLMSAILIGLFLAFILELSNFDLFGIFGGWLKYGQFGLFGIMAYIFPIVVLMLFILSTYETKRTRMILSLCVLFLFVCTFSHLVSSLPLINRNVLSYFQICAESKNGGGILGGGIALGLYLLLSKTGAIIFSVLIILFCLVILFEDPVRHFIAVIFGRSENPARAESKSCKSRRTEQDDRNEEEEDALDDFYDDQYYRKIDDHSGKQKRSGRRIYEEPVYVTEDDQGTVIRIVHTYRKHGRVHNTPLTRSNKKAQPIRDGSGTTTRSGIKVRGISKELDMIPHNANGDEIHEITRQSARAGKKSIPSGSAQELFANTVIPPVPQKPEWEDLTGEQIDLFDYAEKKKKNASAAAVTKVRQAAVNQRIREEKPVKGKQKEMQGSYSAPPMELLAHVRGRNRSSEAELEKTARKLELILEQFGVHVTVTDIQAGPSVTRFELQPELGTRVNKITSLADDLKLNLGATEIRIEAPIPGRQAVGIEIPNKNRQTVYMRELLEEPALISHASKIAFAAGKDISGNVVVADIAKMPHLLVAGTTGSGKSVFLNTILMTILFRAKPSEVGLIIIDPKKVEFGVYAGIPHLMKDVVTDPGQAVSTLRWAVNEMTNRYQRMQLSSVRDFRSYNKKVEKGTVNPEEEHPRKMNQIVIIIDELADLMMVAKKEAEALICRLAQLARAAGIHLIIATQRPSVDVVTGLIKANVPARVALLVSSQIDSRTIIDMPGAEKLLGNGDMLFYPTGYVKPVRVQGAFVSDDEIMATVDYLVKHNETEYFAEESREIEKFMNSQQSDDGSGDAGQSSDEAGKYDDCFYEAGKLCIEMGKASSSMLQRRFNLGFNRAARIIDQLEEFGAVGPQNGAKPREILVDSITFEEMYQELMKQK